jgi:hypothetical protein
MEKGSYTVTREYEVTINIAIGDEITYRKHGYGIAKGKINYIYADVKKIVVDDKDDVPSTLIESINGTNIRNIKGEMRFLR